LLELRRERLSLEQIFIQLTREEPVTAEAAPVEAEAEDADADDDGDAGEKA
jgi:hypothetical protein